MMTHRILAEVSVSIAELKTNSMKIVASGNGIPINTRKIKLRQLGYRLVYCKQR